MYATPQINAAGVFGIGATGALYYFANTLAVLVLLFAVLAAGTVLRTLHHRHVVRPARARAATEASRLE